MSHRRGDKMLSPHPSGLAAVNPANPQTWNEYAYVANQPLTATDPLGLCPDGTICTPVGAGLYCPRQTCTVQAAPWEETDPEYWLFSFGIEGAAELEQVSGGVAALAQGLLSSVAKAVKSLVDDPNVRAVNQCAANLSGQWSIAGIFGEQNSAVTGGLAGNGVGTIIQLIFGPGRGSAATPGAMCLSGAESW